MKNKIIFTIDVEPDLHTGGYRGLSEGLRKAEKLFYICGELANISLITNLRYASYKNAESIFK